MESDIKVEMEENIIAMEKLISKQDFKIKDAEHFLKRYFNIFRKLEQLEISRDNWKAKYLKVINKGGIK